MRNQKDVLWFYVPHTRIKMVRFDLSSEDNGEGDPAKLLKPTTHSTVTQQVTVSLLLWLAMLIVIRVALSRSPQRLSWWRVYWPETSIFAIKDLDAAGFHHILRADLIDNHRFRQTGRFLLEMELFRVGWYWNIDLRALPGRLVLIFLFYCDFLLLKGFELGKPISCTGKYNRFLNVVHWWIII